MSDISGFKTLEDYVGNTPLVRLKRINAGTRTLRAAARAVDVAPTTTQ